jgi:hypothetical protein
MGGHRQLHAFTYLFVRSTQIQLSGMYVIIIILGIIDSLNQTTSYGGITTDDDDITMIVSQIGIHVIQSGEWSCLVWHWHVAYIFCTGINITSLNSSLNAEDNDV